MITLSKDQKTVISMDAVHMTKTDMMEFCQFCYGITEPVSADAVLKVFNEIDKAADWADREY